MPNKMACVIWDKCHPEECNDGTCLAAKACPRKLLSQEARYQAPMMNAAICRACGDCVRSCPLNAIQIIDI